MYSSYTLQDIQEHMKKHEENLRLLKLEREKQKLEE